MICQLKTHVHVKFPVSQFVCVVVQGSVLTNRKSSSTPSLSDVSESKSSVASTEQAASAENLTSTIKVVSCGYDTTLHFMHNLLSQ